MKLRAACACLLFFFLSVTVVYAVNEKIHLKIGQEEFRKVGSIKRLSVANPSVVDAKVLQGGKQIMIRGYKPGRSTVTIFDDNEKKIIFDVTVISSLGEVAQEIKEMIKDIDKCFAEVIENPREFFKIPAE